MDRVEAEQAGLAPASRLLRGVLDAARIAALGETVGRALGEVGLGPSSGSAPGSSGPGAGLTGLGWDDPRWIGLQQRVLPSPALAAVREDPGLLAALCDLLGGPVAGEQGDIVRVTFPGQAALTTRPHQDGFYRRDAQEAMVTVWIPLVPCPLDLGPLALWRGDAARGVRPHALGPLGVPELVELPSPEEAPEAWWAAPLGLGDALVFGADVIHAALPNRTAATLRLSVDLRYRRAQPQEATP
jgi:hypothetical protein